MRRRLYIGVGNDVSLRVACLPKALIATFFLHIVAQPSEGVLAERRKTVPDRR